MIDNLYNFMLSSKLINDKLCKMILIKYSFSFLKIRRTYKLLSCLNRSTFILNERWLGECKKNRMFSSNFYYEQFFLN